MSKLSKRIKDIRKSFDTNKTYDLIEAFNILKSSSKTNFVESVDVSINLNINPKKNNIKNTVYLPNGIGKINKIAVFADDKFFNNSLLKDIDYYGLNDLAEKFKKKSIKNVDIVICHTDAIKIVSPLGSILGPKGLMPNLKLGTLTSNISEAISKFKKHSLFIKNDKNGIIHSKIGNVEYSEKELEKNFYALLKNVIKNKPINHKGSYIYKISLSSTMGINVKFNYDSLI